MQRELRVFALYGAIKHSIESLIAARKTHFRLPAVPPPLLLLLLFPLQQRNNAPDQDSRNQASSVQATCNLIYVGDDQLRTHTHTYMNIARTALWVGAIIKRMNNIHFALLSWQWRKMRFAALNYIVGSRTTNDKRRQGMR